jgi:site-specific recombinase XerD
MRPQTYLFPGTRHGWRADAPITPKVVWDAVQYAKQRAGIQKRVTPHTLRHYLSFLTMSCPISRGTSLRGECEAVPT